MYKTIRLFWYVFIMLLCIPRTLRADLLIPDIFSDHMVLQQGVPIPVWGTAGPGEEITVTFSKDKATVMTDVAGNWKLELPAMNAGGPYILKISAEGKSIMFRDVLIGEVWLCSGQSNMEWPLEKAASAEKTIPAAEHQEIRLFLMKKNYALDKKPFTEEMIKDINVGRFYKEARWQTSTPETAAKFSAVAYFFAKQLYDSLRVPIGLIQNAVGGSPIQSWVSKDGLEGHPQLEYLMDSTSGKTWHYQSSLHPWVAERALENLQLWFDKGEKGAVPRHPFGPAYLFDHGMGPLLPYPIKGMLWYQGESDATNPELYVPMFQQLVNDIRKAWRTENLPVIFVQLPRIGNRNRWPEFREVQQRGLTISNTVMVVTIDTGHPTDVHPREKRLIGERMAAAALGKWYGKEVPYQGPILKDWTIGEGQMRLEFSHTGNGLTVQGGVLANVVLEGYNETGTVELAIRPSSIKVSGSVVIIGIPDSFSITTLKYAWLPYPEEPLLYNSHNLPASPFKVELPGNN